MDVAAGLAVTAGKSSIHYTMRNSFKYALAFLATMLLIAFFSRERFTTMYPSSEEPENPETLLPPFSYAMFTKGGPDVTPTPGQIGNDLPMGNV